MPWNPEHYMKKEEVIKILEDNKITNIEKDIKPVYINAFQKKIDSHVYHEAKSDLHYNVIKPQTDRFLEQWDIPKSESILDIGCGDGYFLSLLKEKGYENILGITKSDKDIEECYKKGLTGNIYKTDMTFTGLKRTFDNIWCRHCLEHSPFPLLTLHEFNRLIKMGGHGYIEVPAADCEKRHEDNINHYSLLTQRNWISLILRGGFDVEKVQNIDLTIRDPNYQDGKSYPERWWGFYLTKTVELNFLKGEL